MTFSINHLTIQNAYSVQFGGGIVNAGKLIVTNSTFSHNQDTRAGGAIFCLGFADSLTVNASLFDTNSSFGDGGAISSGCQASISNSTFYNNNSAAGDGGAISVVSKVTTITNTTFSHNASGPGHATISSATGSALTLRNTILAGNTNANCSAISGTITDGGYNLDDDGSCGLSATGSLSGNANAHLGPLSSNGGPTQTIALQTGSAAIGVVPAGTNGCATTLLSDQRGVARPGSLNGACSMGAYEYVPPADHTITDCSTDAQLNAAYQAGGRIVFACGPNPVTISVSRYPNLSANTTIDGTGNKITLDQGNSHFFIIGGVVLTFNNLTFSNSTAGVLTVYEDSKGIVTNCTLSGNSAFDAIIDVNFASAIISNSTIVNNTVSGKIPVVVESHESQTTITNTTIANNTAIFAIDADGGAVALQNSLLVGKFNPGDAQNCGGRNNFTDLGYNLSDDVSCSFTTTSSLTNNKNANLGSLSDNGGPTQTVALSTGSSAVDAIPVGVSGCGFSPDQRGSVRPSGPGCDIGAYEAAEIPVPFATDPTGLAYSVNGTNYSSAQAPFLVVGGQYPVAATDPQTANATRYAFQSWSDNGALSHSITVSASNPIDYLASFVATYPLTTSVSPSGGGAISVSPSPTNGFYSSGTIVNLSATPNLGYAFASWSGAGSSNGASATVTMNAARSVTAIFVRIFTLTASVSPSGTGTVSVLTPPNSGSSYTAGTSVSISAAPNPGYVFSGWTGSADIANPAAAATAVTMNANESVTANFTAANAATFLPLDSSTQGNWPGVYGGDGYIIANNGSNNHTPSYAAVNFSGASSYSWIGAAPSSDIRLLQTAPNSGNRIGSTFYSGSSFSIDLTLSGGQHQVALYLLDLDTTTRSDTVTLRNAGTQAVLDTRTISNFHNGVWAVWTMSGHVTIQVSNSGGLNAVVAGIFFSTLSSTPAAPAVTIYSPAANQAVTGAITLSANVSAPAGVQNVQFVLDGTTVLSPLIPGPGATFTYQWNSATVGNGPHTLEVIGKDNLSQTSQSSVTFSVQNGGAPMASAQFVAPADTATQGNWVGKYGSDGFWIANDPSSAPPVYAAINFSGATNWTWNGSTGDTRALLTSPTGSPGARIASTYFSNTAFTIDLNLNDNQQHAVALYLLDYDDGRSESIQIVDANNPSLVLDSRALSGFQNGEYLVWKIQGHVRIQITNTGGLNAVVSGIFFSTVPSGGQQQPPAVTVTAPTANQQVSGVFKLQATATSTGSVASVQFLVDNSPAGPAITQGVNSTYSYDLDTTSLNNGMHSIKAVAIDNLSQQTTASAVSFSVSNASAGGSSAAVFVRTDTTTQGNWKGVYGSAGEIIANDSNAPPSFAVVNVAGANSFTWTYTSDPRAPLIAASNSNRIASVFYNSPGFSIDLNLTDGNTHQLALYLLDWDGAGRAETITIAAAANPGTILDSRPISGFGNGVYLVWNITGHVKIQVTGSAGPNAVVNALFLR